MGPAHQIDVLILQEVGNDVAPEDETDSPLVFSPPRHALLRIRPQKIAEQSLVGHLKRSDQLQDLLKVLQLRTEPAMHAHNLLVNESADGHDIEDVREGLPQLDVVFAFA